MPQRSRSAARADEGVRGRAAARGRQRRQQRIPLLGVLLLLRLATTTGCCGLFCQAHLPVQLGRLLLDVPGRVPP